MLEPFLPPPAGPGAEAVDDLFIYAVWLITVTFAVVLAILGAFLWHYRARAGHKAQYVTGDSRGTTWFTLTFAAVVFVVIDVNLAYKDLIAYEKIRPPLPSENEALVVHVFARQFEWHFRYAGLDGKFWTEDDLTARKLVLPADKPIFFKMRSQDVVHSFFPVHFRVKQDVVPGLTIAMTLTAPTTTREMRARVNDPDFEYEIACAELCGSNHTNMRAIMEVLTADEFDAWIKERTQKRFSAPEIWECWPEGDYVPPAPEPESE